MLFFSKEKSSGTWCLLVLSLHRYAPYCPELWGFWSCYKRGHTLVCVFQAHLRIVTKGWDVAVISSVDVQIDVLCLSSIIGVCVLCLQSFLCRNSRWEASQVENALQKQLSEFKVSNRNLKWKWLLIIFILSFSLIRSPCLCTGSAPAVLAWHITCSWDPLASGPSVGSLQRVQTLKHHTRTLQLHLLPNTSNRWMYIRASATENVNWTCRCLCMWIHHQICKWKQL